MYYYRLKLHRKSCDKIECIKSWFKVLNNFKMNARGLKPSYCCLFRKLILATDIVLYHYISILQKMKTNDKTFNIINNYVTKHTNISIMYKL